MKQKRLILVIITVIMLLNCILPVIASAVTAGGINSVKLVEEIWLLEKKYPTLQSDS